MKRNLKKNIIFHLTLFVTLLSSGVVNADTSLDPPSGIEFDGIFVTPTNSNSKVINSTNQKQLVQITDAKNSQIGAIWSAKEHRLDLSKEFKASMYLYLGDNSRPADGIAFVIHNDQNGVNAVGAQGESIGVWRNYSAYNINKVTHPEIKNSFAVEIDTYHNSGIDNGFDELVPDVNKNNPATEAHIAWGFPGGVRVNYNTSGPQDPKATYLLWPRSGKFQTILNHHDLVKTGKLADDTWRKFVVKWTPPKNIEDTNGPDGIGYLTYILEGKMDKPVKVPIPVLNTFNDTKVYYGFTGSTGGANAKNHVSFDQIPGYIVTKEKSDIVQTKAGVENSVVGSSVRSGSTVTYKYETKYIEGKKKWQNVSFHTTIGKSGTIVPGSVRMSHGTSPFEVLPDSVITNNGHTLNVKLNNGEDISDQDPYRIYFDVKTDQVDKTTVMNESGSFIGKNLVAETDELSYEIMPRVVDAIHTTDTGIQLKNSGDTYYQKLTDVPSGSVIHARDAIQLLPDTELLIDDKTSIKLVIPKGLNYVENSLLIDGQKILDSDDAVTISADKRTITYQLKQAFGLGEKLPTFELDLAVGPFAPETKDISLSFIFMVQPKSEVKVNTFESNPLKITVANTAKVTYKYLDQETMKPLKPSITEDQVINQSFTKTADIASSFDQPTNNWRYQYKGYQEEGGTLVAGESEYKGKITNSNPLTVIFLYGRDYGELSFKSAPSSINLSNEVDIKNYQQPIKITEANLDANLTVRDTRVNAGRQAWKVRAEVLQDMSTTGDIRSDSFSYTYKNNEQILKKSVPTIIYEMNAGNSSTEYNISNKWNESTSEDGLIIKLANYANHVPPKASNYHGKIRWTIDNSQD